MTKQDKIKEAYGESWGKAKGIVDENGWIKRELIAQGVSNGNDPDLFGFKDDLSHIERTYFGSGNYNWRPKALRGFEYNNGWTKIENPEDLPKKVGKYLCMNGNYGIYELWHEEGVTWRSITHWREIVEINKPIY